MSDSQTPRNCKLDAAGDFGRRLAHEVRSPIGTVVGALTELKHGNVEPEAARRLATLAEKASRRLIRLADRLDWLTALADDAVASAGQQTSVAKVVSNAMDEAERFAARSRVTLERPRLDPDLRVHTDEAALGRIIAELVHNAIRNARKNATVEVRSEGDQIIIDVHDDGRGIDAQTREGLFQPHQGVSSGLGVGLWLARSLSDRLGATLQLVATGDQGTHFALSIPAGG